MALTVACLTIPGRQNYRRIAEAMCEGIRRCGDKAFMPVQYTTLHIYANDMGDPAMAQAIPVEQFLNRYAFVTGIGYDVHYVQVIREAGTAPVYVDGRLHTTLRGDNIVAEFIAILDRYVITNFPTSRPPASATPSVMRRPPALSPSSTSA